MPQKTQSRSQPWLGLFAVICHTLSFFSPLLLIPLLWKRWSRIATVVYVVWCLIPRRLKVVAHQDAAKRAALTRWWWSSVASYFPISLHRTEPLDPDRKYILGYHPHGALIYGGLLALGTDALGFSDMFPGIRNTFMISDPVFRAPFFGHYASLANVASVSRESCDAHLSSGGRDGRGTGQAIVIAVGGEREVPQSRPRTANIILKNRLGFVRVAIRHGADLVPTFGFGENDVFDLLDTQCHPAVTKTEDFLFWLTGRKYPIFYTTTSWRYVTSMIPYRKPIHVVVGRPVRVRQEDEPSPEQVRKVHAQYVEELERVWSSWRDYAGVPKAVQLTLI